MQLHLLLPAVLSCLLAKQVCASPNSEDHWALREYSGNIMAHIVRQFDAADNGILPRVIGQVLIMCGFFGLFVNSYHFIREKSIW